MKKEIQEISFNNKNNPKSYFDIVRIEDLLKSDLDHDIGKNHLVKFYIIIFITEGEGYHTIDFTDYNYTEGTVLLIRKDQIHRFFRSPNVKGYVLIFTEEFIISHLNKMAALNSMQLFNDSLNYPKIILDDKEMFLDFSTLIKHLEQEYNIKDSFSIGITRSVLHILMTKLFRIKDKKGLPLKEKKYTIQFLDFQQQVEKDCFKNRQVQYYAKELGVSTKTLNNIVKNIVNIPAKVFIDERTIMQIKRMLIGSNIPIKEIAYDAGFSDPTNFYKYFKKFTGSTPEVFRKAH